MPADPMLERVCGTTPSDAPPRILVVAAHPDDETIGAGARIASLGAACTIVHITDGAPADRRFFPQAAAGMSRPAYARVRRDEALRALALAGVDEARVVRLEVHDQDTVYEMAEVAEQLAKLAADLRPDVIVTHAYEGGHPDHDATAFAVHAALALGGATTTAAIVEMTSYHDQGGTTVRGEFLARPGVREVTVELDEDERRRKRAMLAAYSTQREILAPFRVELERFRAGRPYHFDRPPHDGRLHYERFGFAVTGPMWRALGRSAVKKLGLEGGAF